MCLLLGAGGAIIPVDAGPGGGGHARGDRATCSTALSNLTGGFAMRAKLLLVLAVVLTICGRSANADLPGQVRPPGPAPGGRGAFVPNAGYLRTAKQLYLERQTAKTTGRPPVAAPRAVPALSGVRSIPVICL